MCVSLFAKINKGKLLNGVLVRRPFTHLPKVIGNDGHWFIMSWHMMAFHQEAYTPAKCFFNLIPFRIQEDCLETAVFKVYP
jgi:hypothetical protein